MVRSSFVAMGIILEVLESESGLDVVASNSEELLDGVTVNGSLRDTIRRIGEVVVDYETHKSIEIARLSTR